MRAVLQRVTRAQVVVDDETVGSIGAGLVVLLGVTHDDDEGTARSLAAKVAGVRILRGEQGLPESGGAALVVSQFTLYGDARKGRRPTWSAAAPGDVAEPLYEEFCRALRSLGVDVATGRFGADMAVELVNDGPTTLLLEM